MQKRFLTHRLRQDGAPELAVKAEDPPYTQRFLIHDLRAGALRLDWCASADAPGLLAVGTGTGLVALVPMDSLLLVQ